MRWKLWAKRFGAVFLVLLAVFFAVAPSVVESRMNRVAPAAPVPITAPGRAMHQQLFIADLHADTALWKRDLLVRSARGHVDVPRLIEGGLALQAFTIVNQFPRPSRDLTGLLAFAQLWRPSTWFSPQARTLYQAERLVDSAARSEGRLRIVRTRKDLESLWSDRSPSRPIVGGLIGVEGAQALEGDLKSLDTLFAAGIRMMAPTHFFNNDVGGAGTEKDEAGLTPLGRSWVKRMEELGMTIDLAHASERTIADVTDLATKPLLISHTGVRGICDNPRNISDEAIRRIAARNGVIGIAYFELATCSKDVTGIVRSIRHVIHTAGIDHVALGSDFDGAITAPFDTTRLGEITQALLNIGLTEADLRKVMGANAVGVLAASLPQ